MGKHLDRLGVGHILAIEKLDDGAFELIEGCDNYFSEKFTAEELRELAAEIVELSRS